MKLMTQLAFSALISMISGPLTAQERTLQLDHLANDWSFAGSFNPTQGQNFTPLV